MYSPVTRVVTKLMAELNPFTGDGNRIALEFM
jgi:hypothetical protein